MEQALEKLIKCITDRHAGTDVDMVALAYDFSQQAHQGQTRLTGEPYFIHPYNVAIILAEMNMSPDIVVAGLLHDVTEESGVSISQLEKEFGKDVAFLVDGVTKVGKVKYRGVERYLENLRKMFVAVAVDLRVIIVRLADRLDNLRTLYVHAREKQVRIAQESLEIYAPIANRLGMGEIKGLIEDEAFKYALPEEYQWVKGLATKRQAEQQKYLRTIEKRLTKELREQSIEYISIHGRVKHLYSLYLKLLRYDRDITRVHDLVALRVIVKNIADCYRVLGMIHSLWPPMQGRIKDYIARPKINGYQSLHTTVFTEDKRVVEIQIRSQEMHDQAEFGVAAHWRYDEDQGVKPALKKIGWVEELAQWKQEIEDNQRNLERLKVDVLKNRIFVFTPKGDVIDLPESSTPVDFAYSIHTDIGDKCSRAYVNDAIVNLDHQLKNGDIVEVLIDKNRKGPNPDWLQFVKSSTARAHIKAATRAERHGFLSKLIGS
ncbi:bifunctional (p)ppGpp synthetase/guanosine-3',5'-bis(diphosphate) 3'-pyrophosphohydrolase [Candidatus Falkowbacteria bacterium]|nr:bifunctional (p)ppGpp synthetase/guanosine-3',5'-bis(diphosphate) 3'-pyrophosphohydrolase [Candidatus Falkowbacteria bacterium]